MSTGVYPSKDRFERAYKRLDEIDQIVVIEYINGLIEDKSGTTYWYAIAAGFLGFVVGHWT
jgi:tetrahydromethanopterin S-methyltransferase subunit G